MNGKVLLDTNIVIALFSQDRTVHEALSRADEVFVPSIVLGELYYGAYKSVEVGPNISHIDDFAHQSAVLSCDSVAAQYYGRVKNFLRTKGRPIPENDIWIAALAQQHNLTLVTRDDHFKAVENVSIEMWSFCRPRSILHSVMKFETGR